MRPGPLLMDVTAEFTGGCTDAPTAMLDGLTPAPTTPALPPITTVLPRTTTVPALITVLLRITVVPAFTLALGAGIRTRREARQPRNNSRPLRRATTNASLDSPS